jgi:hypothetical protein
MMNNRLRQEDLRKKISQSKQLSALLCCLEAIGEIDNGLKTKQKLSTEERALHMTRLAALKSKMEGHMRLLKKILPDMQSTPVTWSDDDLPSLTLRVIHDHEQAD